MTSNTSKLLKIIFISVARSPFTADIHQGNGYEMSVIPHIPM